MTLYQEGFSMTKGGMNHVSMYMQVQEGEQMDKEDSKGNHSHPSWIVPTRLTWRDTTG
jgi:hypothetical protein